VIFVGVAGLVAGVVIAVAALTVVWLADQRVRRREREFERERQAWQAERVRRDARETDLLDRLMHATDKTWTPPPREELSQDELDVFDLIDTTPESTFPDFVEAN
jgi:hypothetical protein